MSQFSIQFHPLVQADVQSIVLYYEKEVPGLGSRFFNELKTSYESLKINPFYHIRYANVRCLKVNKFPYMVHFTVDELINVVFIQAVIGTSQNPDTHWKNRTV